MKVWPIQTVAVVHEIDVVAVRQQARRIAELLEFDTQDQTRIATAVSEIARNAHAYGARGRVEFILEGARRPERLLVRVSDTGPGFDDVESVLAGRFTPTGEGLGLGIAGARRLMDALEIVSRPGDGAVIAMRKRLPADRPPIAQERLAQISSALTAGARGDPITELRAQNQELMQSLAALESRRIEAVHLSEELERTNKGVVALYAELDRRALELEELNVSLESRIQEALAERARIEERLRQSQKMEAVGQLTGGVAHDFNNLLMVIGGSLELLRRRAPQTPDVTRLLDAAADSVARGAALNRQLLAFARRQDLVEETLCLGDLAPSFVALVKRAISEDIAIESAIAEDLWFCRTDPHQLESAVLNLALNARDAMPGGGALTLTVENRTVDEEEARRWDAEPGDYVVVAVADTGVGIAHDMIPRVVEPFYTTKEVGKGTGLGLSQVYGFARQSGGFLAIESDVGAGAKMLIHLRRSAAPGERHTPEAPAARAASGDASVLLVEDEPAVRATTSAMLRDLGYRVVEAADGKAALEMLAERAFDIVFSDVVLPGGISGVDLARAVRRSRPGTAVLLTSGYTARRLDAGGGDDFPLLRKPFDGPRLSEALACAMDPTAPALLDADPPPDADPQPHA